MKNANNRWSTLTTNHLEAFPQAIERAQSIKQLKVFDSLDGHGIKLLASIGVQCAIISGRQSTMVAARAKELGIEHVFMAVGNKLETLNALLKHTGGSLKTTAAMGDDWPDLPVLTRVHLACAPAQAHPGVLEVAHFVSNKSGGQGAVRELCDLILKAQGHYDRLLEEAKSA